MKFDVVVGNPPYNKGNSALWKKFATKSITMGNIIGLVTPRNIVNGRITTNGPDGGFFEDIKHNLSYINYAADNYFSVGKKICAWVYNHNDTLTTSIITSNSVKLHTNIANFYYLPYNFTSVLDFEIFTKLQPHETMCSFKNATYRPSGNYLVIPQIKHISLKYVSVVKDLDKDTRKFSSELVLYSLRDDEVLGCASYIASRIYKFTFELYGGSDVRAGIFKRIPKIDFTKIWTDDELYKHFNLTQEEIDYVESKTK